MVWLARYCEADDIKSATVAAALMVFGLLFPLALWLSLAVVALSALLQDDRRTLLKRLLIGAVFVSLLTALATFGATLAPALLLQQLLGALLLWLPIALLGRLLRSSHSLSLTLFVAALAACFLLLVVQLVYPQLESFWRDMLAQMYSLLFEQAEGGVELSAADKQAMLDRLVPWMTPFMLASLTLVYSVALLLGRFWQGRLQDKPLLGGEWAQMRSGRVQAITWVVLGGLCWLLAPLPLKGAWLVLFVVAVLHGLAIVYGGLLIRSVSARGWILALVYILTVFWFQFAALLAVLALLDPWVDWRARLAGARQ